MTEETPFELHPTSARSWRLLGAMGLVETEKLIIRPKARGSYHRHVMRVVGWKEEAHGARLGLCVLGVVLWNTKKRRPPLSVLVLGDEGVNWDVTEERRPHPYEPHYTPHVMRLLRGRLGAAHVAHTPSD